MVYIKIDANYKIKDNSVIIEVLKELNKGIQMTIKEYPIKDKNYKASEYTKETALADAEMNFYNKILDDFDAEFDDELAEVLDKLVCKIIEEVNENE